MITFEETGLNPKLLTAVAELGFENPTPIQQQAIPTILNNGQDLIALAQTGTGKTAAFGLPVLHQIDTDNPNVQAIILCPTRELAIQIHKDLDTYSKYLRGMKAVAVYGGASINDQIRALRRSSQIVVGTPGRVLDLIKRRVLKLNEIKWVVLDEADEMLNMGFQEDLDSILSETPEEKQTLLFSATMPPAIARISKRYMTDPAEISVGEKNSGAKNVQHEFYMVHARYRYEALRRIVDMNSDMYAIIFCRTRSNTNEVARKLGNDGYEADAINGDLSQAQRDQVMGRFRNRQIQFLVATDVAARGIDIDDLTHVINYELPDELEVYVHRSGRTGRAGKSGISMSIIHTRETRAISMLERMVQKRFERKPIPSGKDICEQQLLKLVDKIEKVEVDESQIEPFLPNIYEKLSWLSREELIKHVISVEFNRFIAHYKDAADLNVTSRDSRDRRDRDRGGRGDRRDRDRRDRGGRDRRDRGERRDGGERERGGRRGSTSFSRFHINLGSKHELNPNRLMGLINEQTQNKNVRIGKIDIMKKFSFFEIESQFSSQLPDLFQGASFEGIPAIIQPAEPDVKGEAKSKRPFHDRFGKKKKDKRKTGGSGRDRERRKRK